ncbi:PREDICTED: venom acid phosphatase Acph-1-like [Dinoponera quadriceps]|uniref:acid phosphatase n=1 Tax=Dinoponera quadriceps TaxID=609295 RepID=A0A6P3X1E1_DINQU|nr:PREDICTED: venom acid phosphatase Acph-1-like [Dinoponera quadriceps]
MNGSRFACVTLALCIVRLSATSAVPDLKLVHVLFAHKLYAPREDQKAERESLPRLLSYEYFISARKNMSNTSNLNMYNLGVHLRKIYSGFLGDGLQSYEPTKMRSTEYALSILSAQLVNAGLWPPTEEQMWMTGLNWQPMPANYMELKEDVLMLGSLCPNFISRMNEVLETAEMRETLSQYQPLFDYLSYYTERNISTPSDVALLYASLETMADQDEMLPHWARDVFPHGTMYNVTLSEYDLLSATLLQRQLNGGTFLAEIVGNSLKYMSGEIPENRKMMLYSGDGRNIAGVLRNLDLWSPHIPNEAAALIFELYLDNDTDTYGIKINYYTGVDETTIALSLPNCTEICPLQTLLDVVFELIPQNPRALCGWITENSTPGAKDADPLSLQKNNSSDSSGSANWCGSGGLIFNLTLLNLFSLVLAVR